MENWKKFSRVFFLFALLTSLLAGISAPVLGNESASAAPMKVVLPGDVVISEFRFLGPAGANDEFIELYNPKNVPIDLTGLKIMGSDNAGATGTLATLGSVTLSPGQYYLLVNNAASAGLLALQNATYATDLTPDGGIAITLNDGTTIIDQVGLSVGAAYKEGAPFTPLASTADQSYERKLGGASDSCLDTTDNLNDFQLITPSNPQNLSTPRSLCGIVGELSITNDVSNPTPNVGSNVVFTITVSNLSSSNATLVRVNALLPAATLVYVSHAITPTTPATNYNIGSGLWDIGALNSGASMTLRITASVASGNSVFQAVVSSNQFPTNSDTATVNPIASTEADLSLSQTWTRSTTAAGRVDLKITVTNNETVNSATNVQVKDLLPSGLTYFSHTGGTYNNSTGIWAVGTLLPGVPNARTLTIVANVSTTSDSALKTNIAEIWQSDQFDPNSIFGDGKGIDDYTSVVVTVADLSLTERVDYSVGSAVFTVTVRNSGPDDASNIVVKNSKLASVANYTYVSHGDTSVGGSYNIATGDWTIPYLLDGARATLTVTTTIVLPAVNWAQVSTVIQVDPDSRPGNCSNTVLSCTEDDDASAPSADLSLTQSVNNPNPDTGTNVVFTITVSNAGVAATTNVQVKDTLPSGLTYVSDNGGGKYNKTSGIWTVTASTDPPFANGASRTLIITTKVAANGVKTNLAEVWRSDEADPDSTPGNGSITEDDDDGATITSYRSIVINEVAWSGTAASADDEWIELYNPSNASINVTGWILKSTSTASSALNITLSGSIAAGGYFLLERDNNSTVSDVVADQIYPGGALNILADTGEKLNLNDSSGNFIDTANQEGSSSSTNPWPKGSLAPNYGSMERVGTSAETDKTWVTNIGNPRNGVNANNGPIYGTPKKANSTGANPPPIPVVPTVIVYSSRIVINEFLPRPGFDWNQDGQVDVFDEFIEIKNIGNATGSISGWKLDDEVNQGSNPYTLPDITLKVGERMVFYGSQTNILLSDGGDTVRLLDPNGKVFDSYTYSFAEFEDQSVCRLPDGFGSWYEDCVPTPNLINTREGAAPSMPDSGGDFVSPVCDLPDTIPADFLYAECGGYGAEVWHSYYWDQSGWYAGQYILSNRSKWESFVQ